MTQTHILTHTHTYTHILTHTYTHAYVCVYYRNYVTSSDLVVIKYDNIY